MNLKPLMTFAALSILSFGLASCTQPTSNQSSPEAISSTSDAASSPEASEIAATEPTTPDTPDSTATASPDTNLVFFAENGIAIEGTDPVAYFTQGQPVAGQEEFSYEWGGATWLFSSAENRDRFVSNPEQYAPQYGGFCAWAVSQGYTAPIDPNAWKIVDGRLYLNFNQGVQRRWERDIPGNIAQGDQNWVGLQAELISQQ